MPKTIVTHLRPDLDACSSVWLVKKYIPGFHDATVEYVPAGKTLQGQITDTDPNAMHVDTGLGKFDHHQFKERLSAFLRIFDYLKEHSFVPSREVEVLHRMGEIITMIDNFEESSFPNPEADYYDLSLHQLIEGYKYIEHNDNLIMLFAETALDAFFANMRHKVEAEKAVNAGYEFMAGNLKGLALETRSEDAVSLAQKMGYALVVRKDPRTQRARIKLRPNVPYTLEKVYEALCKKDSRERWFYHMSGKMVLNGSSKNPSIEPTKMTLKEIVSVVQECLS